MFQAVNIGILDDCNDLFKSMIKCDKDRQEKLESISQLNDPEHYAQRKSIINAVHQATMDNYRKRRILLSDLLREMNKMEIIIISKEIEDKMKIHALNKDCVKKNVLFAQLKEHYENEKKVIAGLCMKGDVVIAKQRANAISPASRLLSRSCALSDYRQSRSRALSDYRRSQSRALSHYRRSRSPYQSRSRSRSRSRNGNKSGV
jgi:hypothetical protein